MSAIYITLIVLISFHRTCHKAEFFYLYMSGSTLEDAYVFYSQNCVINNLFFTE